MNEIFERIGVQRLIKKVRFKKENGFSVILEYDKDTLKKMNIFDDKKYICLLRFLKLDNFGIRIQISCCLYENEELIMDNSYIKSFFKPFDFDVSGQYFLSQNMNEIRNIKHTQIDINDLICHFYNEHTQVFRKKILSVYVQVVFKMFLRGIFFLFDRFFSFLYFIRSGKKFDLYKFYYIDTQDSNIDNPTKSKNEENTNKNANIFGVIFPKLSAVIFFVLVVLLYTCLYINDIKSNYILLIAKYNVLTVSFSVVSICIIEMIIRIVKNTESVLFRLAAYFGNKYEKTRFFRILKKPSLLKS